jgi:hypothetical protein
MSLWNEQTPPVLYPNAVATDAGWADPVTGELLIAITGLSTFKGGAAELVRVGLTGNTKSQFTTSAVLGNDRVYAAGDYMVLEAVFSEAVTWSGTPTIAASINGNSRTFAYFQDTTDIDLATDGRVMSVTIGSGGSNYKVGDKITFTVANGHTGSSAHGYVSAVDGGGAITAITMDNNGASYDIAPTPVVHTGYVVSVAASGGTAYVNGDALTFTGGAGSGAAGYIVTNSNGSLNRAVVTNGGTGYTSAPTVGKVNLYGSGGTLTATVSHGSGASLTAVLGTPVNGKGTNRILFRYQVQANETATSSQITFTSPIGGGASWNDSDGTSGGGATAHAVTASGVTSYHVTNAGSGYTSVPAVTVSGDGTGATAHAVLDKGINTVVPLVAGKGYRSAPTCTPVGGSGAAVTAVLATAGIVCDVTVGGSKTVNYVNGEAVVVDNTGHGGTGFAATLIVNGSGVITGVTITNTGSGYTSAPGLTMTTGSGQTLTAVLGFAVASYNVTNAGSGFVADGTGVVTNATVTVAAPTATAGGTVLGGGVTVRQTATTTTTMKNLQIVAAVVPDADGSGYTAATVAFGGPGSAAAATATVSGEVDHIVVDLPGSQYWVAPTVSITNHAGDTTGENAAATAVVDRGQVIAINMTNKGDSYTLTPTVAFTGVAEVPTLTFDTTQFVSGVTISGTGTGYEDGTALIFSSGAAAGTIKVDSTGNITGVVLTAGGTYNSAPTITVTAPPTWSNSATYAKGQIVVKSGTRYVSKQSGNLNQDPATATAFWTALVDQSLTAVMGSPIVGNCSVDGVAPTISSASILFDRFGDATTQVAFQTGDFFTVTFVTTKPVFVVGVPTVQLSIHSSNVNATYFSGSGSTHLHFTYEITAGDSATATQFTVNSPVVLAGGSTIKDAPGNNLVLTFTPPTTTAVTVN